MDEKIQNVSDRAKKFPSRFKLKINLNPKDKAVRRPAVSGKNNDFISDFESIKSVVVEEIDAVESLEPDVNEPATIDSSNGNPNVLKVPTNSEKSWTDDNYKPQSWLSRRRAKVRRTRRTIRHVDPWSVFKVSLILYACLYGALVVAGTVLWSIIVRSGVVTDIEGFVAEVGSYEVWEINGEEIFSRATVIGAILFAAAVAFNVVLTIIFNLISDLVGGVRLTILEEDEPVER
ncbi:MAG: DUF3566 domain-containing protein [Actinomycetota bacterium]|nr:DUF3566 domain-containing protein [Actinomycetota bacterium]MDG2120421.1 DUF3566 domain-containing protein [Actinomycetota bacterium]